MSDVSQALAALERARMAAAFPQAVATVQSFLLARGQDGVSVDSEVDAITLDGAATVALAALLEELEKANDKLRARVKAAEAPPY